MSFLINSFLNDRNSIISVENPVALSVVNGTAAGSLVFQSTIKAKLASGFHRQIPVSYNTTGYDGNTDGSYSLIGTLAPVAPITNPLNLTVTVVVWVIQQPYFWVDSIDLAKITGGIDNISRIVTAVTGKGVTTSYTQKNALLIQRPSWNGEGCYYNLQSAMLQNSGLSTFTRFTNGGQFTMYFVWKQLAVGNTHIGPIFDSTGGSSSVVGMSLYMDNRTGSGFTNTLWLLIAKGVGGQAPINSHTSNNAVVQDAWNACKIIYNGTNVIISTSVNGGAFTQVASVAPGFTFSASNPANALTFGNLPTVGLSTGIRAYLKHMYMEDSLMSAPHQASLDAWAQAMCLENLQVTDANVYMQVGQSNCAGRGLNSEIDGDLTDRVGAIIMWPQPTPATSTPGSGTVTSDSYFQELQLGVSQTFENIATQHGMEMRFGYNMNEHNQNCWIIKYGVGGTPIFEQVTYNNWNLTTPTLYTQAFNLLGNGFDEITHVFRRNPVWRGLSIMQGETDAVLTGAGAVYKTNWQDVINAWIDAMVALGYTIDKLRIYFWQITDAGGAAYDPTEFALIKAAQAAFPTSYFTDHPSRTANVKGIETRTTDDIDLEDLQHYSAAGQDMRGVIEFDYYKIWTTE